MGRGVPGRGAPAGRGQPVLDLIKPAKPIP